MDIATKLTQIAEKQAENIELNNQLEQTLYGTDTGGKSYYDEFWDIYQDYGNRRDYSHSFSGSAWIDEIFNPKYDIIIEYDQGGYLFRGNRSITNTKKPIRFKKIRTNSSSYVFYNCSNLKTIPLLEVVEGQTYTGCFASCPNLTDITFEGVIGNAISFKDSPLLTKASIESIVNHLSDTQGATLTLSKTAVDNAFKTADGTLGSASDEWLNLIAPKASSITGGESNTDKDTTNGLWTIALV